MLLRGNGGQISVCIQQLQPDAYGGRLQRGQFAGVRLLPRCAHLRLKCKVNLKQLLGGPIKRPLFQAALVVHTLIGHTKRVNSVRWIRGTNGELISGASDGSVVVWARQGDVYQANFIQPIGGPTVNIVDGWTCNGRTIIACAPMEPGVVRVWTRQAPGGEFRPSETCLIGRSLCMGLRLGGFPTSPLLACALEDSKVLLLTETDGGRWIKGPVLAGHEDWVRGLDFAVNGQSPKTRNFKAGLLMVDGGFSPRAAPAGLQFAGLHREDLAAAPKGRRPVGGRAGGARGLGVLGALERAGQPTALRLNRQQFDHLGAG